MIRNLCARSFHLVFIVFFMFYNISFTEKLTCIAVFFIINQDSSILKSSTLSKIVAKKLALFPNHTKLLVGAPYSRWIGSLPERRTLELTSRRYVVNIESKMSTIPRFQKENGQGCLEN